MTQWHMKSGKKPSGGILKTGDRSDKKLAWRGGMPALTTLASKPLLEKGKALGGNYKFRLKKAKEVNLALPKEGKAVKAELVSILDNEADRQFARRNIITKGAVISVKADGKEFTARVSSRPGQNGVVDAIQLESWQKPQEKTKKKAKKKEKEKKKAKEEKVVEKGSEAEQKQEEKPDVEKKAEEKPKEAEK